MDYKTLVLHLTNEASVKQQIAAASDLIAHKGGHVKGVFVMPPVPLPVEFVFPASDEYLRDLYHEYQKVSDSVQAEFLRLAKNRHFQAEWTIVEGLRTSVSDGVIQEARSGDLVLVVNRRLTGESPDVRAAPERIVLESGRPVLLLPEAGEFKFSGARVSVAWCNRAEAARAVFDALPLLKLAGQIRIMTIEENAQATRLKKGMEGADIAAALARHGLSVDIVTVPSGGVPVGKVILDQVANDGADVLVMGGYGHSRLRQLVLGGATRHILEEANIPVLLSH